MKNKYIFIFLLPFCFCMCDNRSVKKESIGKHEIFISEFPKIGLIKYEDPQYLASSKTISLETTETSIIGEITQIEIYDNKIYILDGLIPQLLVFDLEGGYLHTIGSMGQGPGEFLYIRSFYIDEEMSVINIIDNASSAVIQYDKDGNFIKKIKHNNPLLDFVSKAKVVGDKIFCYSGTNWQGYNMYFVLNKNDFSIIKKIRKYSGEYTQNRMFSFGSQPFDYVDGNVRFGTLFSDTILSYRPSDNTINSYLIAKNKTNIVPKTLEAKLVVSDYNYRAVVKEIVKKDEYNIGIFNYFENKRYILWDFITESPDKHAVLWDKKEKKGGYIQYAPNSPDLSSFISSSNNTVIRVWNDVSIGFFKEKLKNDNTLETKYPIKIINLVKEYDLEDNPILILYEFKE